MDNWDEIRTAYQVARLGTVSAAAEVLGVHHATVIRHIDALEKRLNVRLFQRHARGYAPTDAGQDLMQVAASSDDQFAQLQGRLQGQGETVSGELVLTSIAGLSPLLVPHLAAFRLANPEVRLRFVAGARLFRLEYGEAHVAIRVGSAPTEPDNVAQPLGKLQFVLAASHDYVKTQGLPTADTYKDHQYVGDEVDSRAPVNGWLEQYAPADRVVYRTSDSRGAEDAISAGCGIGIVPLGLVQRRADLVEIASVDPEKSADLWLVTHVDLHRTAKVQAFSTFIKSALKDDGL